MEKSPPQCKPPGKNPEMPTRSFRGRPPESRPLLREASREEALTRLKRIGAISDKLAALLNIPEKLYTTYGNDFCSSKELPAYLITSYHFIQTRDPAFYPDFSIAIGDRGFSTFCTLIDTKRGIIVADVVDGVYSEKGWNSFESTLKRAIFEAKERDAQGRTRAMVFEF